MKISIEVDLLNKAKQNFKCRYTYYKYGQKGVFVYSLLIGVNVLCVFAKKSP